MNNSIEEAKEQAALRAVQFVSDGQNIGLGTGTTAAYVIRELGRLTRQGFRVRGVATSRQTESLAVAEGIQLVDLNEVDQLDLTIDGADRVDPSLNLIKGGGGALTREKLVALASRRVIIAVDWTKLVPQLGGSFPLPVEVLPFAWKRILNSLERLGCSARLRVVSGNPLITDNGNYVIDCNFATIEPAQLDADIKMLPGAIESGLFVGITTDLVVGLKDGVDVRSCQRFTERIEE